MNIAVILSGGTGTRLGGAIPKQYMEVCGKRVIEYTLTPFFACEDVDAIRIVAAPEWQNAVLECVEHARKATVGNEHGFKTKFLGFSEPGENRQLSILNALEDIESQDLTEGVNGNSEDAKSGQILQNTYVCIHDAARPLVRTDFLSECFRAAEGHDGVMPVLPMKDTVYESTDGVHVSKLLERSRIFAGQAPEVFRLDRYLEANRALLPEAIKRINGSTEPTIQAGMDIVMVPGDEGNFKITTRADLERFEEIVQKA